MFNLNPPFLKDEKNPGPTCTPSAYMNMMSPKFCRTVSISGFTTNPRCPARIPAKKTKVAPRLTPKIFILPSPSPTPQISDITSTAWVKSGVVISSLNQFMF